MRLRGVIKSWNDERGFGFIQPAQGGEEIFVHIKAISRDAGRPQISQRVYFEVEAGLQGKKRARNVELIQSARPPARSSVKPAARNLQNQSGTLLAIPAFLLLYIVATLLWEPPRWLALIYLLTSVITFLTYASDKSRAQRGAWRTPESTLHVLALAGGWPGALLAQQFLRHKSAKKEFLVIFWATVIMNVAAFIILCSPIARELLAAQ